MAISSVGSGTQSSSIPLAQPTDEEREVSSLLRRFAQLSEKKGPAAAEKYAAQLEKTVLSLTEKNKGDDSDRQIRIYEQALEEFAQLRESEPVLVTDQADVVQLSAASSKPVGVAEPTAVEQPQAVDASPEAPLDTAKHKPHPAVDDVVVSGGGGDASGGEDGVGDVTGSATDQTDQQADPAGGTTGVDEPAVGDNEVTNNPDAGHPGSAVKARVEVPHKGDDGTKDVTDAPTIVTTSDVTVDLQGLNDRIDELARELGKMSDSAAQFQELAGRYEKVIADLTAAPSPGFNGQFGFNDMSLRQINFALRFARRGFNILNLLRGTNPNRPPDSWANITTPLNNGMNLLRRQTGSLLDSQPVLSSVLSGTTGSLFSRTI